MIISDCESGRIGFLVRFMMLWNSSRLRKLLISLDSVEYSENRIIVMISSGLCCLWWLD